MKIPVFLASDNNYAPFVATTMSSILLHTNEFLEFYILDCGISSENKRKIVNTKKYFDNFSIDFISIDLNKYFIEFPELQCISKSMYARYLIPELKPEINRAIYSDIDVAFTGDIKILWQEDLEDKIIGAVPSQRGGLNNNYSEIKNKLHLADSHNFFMSGLLLIDCKKWRKENITKKLLSETEKLKERIDLPDQEIFNVVFNNRYKSLDKKYCVIYKIFEDCYSQNDIEYLKQNQIIVHYPGGYESKPWNNKDLISGEYFWNAVKYTDFKKEINLINKMFTKKYCRKEGEMKKILQNIFSVKNSENKTHKIITILGLKIKIQCINSKYIDIDSKIENLQNDIQSLHTLLNACIDIKQIPPAKGNLRKLQMADLYLLQIFDSICSKYKLNYWLDGGTLLGAIRHKGFIPWDDDIDIGMLRDDYNRIIPILSKELPIDLFEINEGKGFFRKVIRIIFKNSPIQIDIWPYDKYCKSKLSFSEIQDLKQNIYNCYNLFWKHFSHDKICSGEAPFPRDAITQYTNKYILKGNKPVENNPILFRGAEAWLGDRCIYDFQDIYPLKRIKFEDIDLSVPNKSENFLTKYYGNYMNLPNLNLQILGHSNINDKLSQIDEKLQDLEAFYNEFKC